MTVPTISPGEMQVLLSRSGLVLNPGQVADLVLAWRQVAALIATIPTDRPLADDMATAFRLPPPRGEAEIRARAPQPKAQSKTRAKPTAKRRAAAKPAPRKPARRGR